MNSIYEVSFYPRKLKPLYWIYIEHRSGFFLKSLLFIFVVGIFEKQETMPWRKRNVLVSVRKKQPQNMTYFNLSKNFTICEVVSLSFAWFFSLCYHRLFALLLLSVSQFQVISSKWFANSWLRVLRLVFTSDGVGRIISGVVRVLMTLTCENKKSES